MNPARASARVQVLIRPDKLGYEPDTLISNIQSGVETCDVYLTANNQYYKFVQNGVAEDITELLTEKVYDENGELSDNGTVSLLDRTDDYFVDTFKWKDGKYYGFRSRTVCRDLSTTRIFSTNAAGRFRRR
ncbi:MAG: hypothetical protein ACLUSP_04755 [Christensenellales bacterium]